MRAKFIVSIMICVTMVFGVFVMKSNEASGSSKEALIVQYVKSGPSGLDDVAWEKAQGIIVPFDGKEKFAGKKASVSTKAVYTDDDIYFLFKWSDATKSVTKEAWQYDGEKWGHQKGNEDRISILFEINRINNFATKGCAITCHVPSGAPNASEGKFGTTTEAEKGDLWHWKAARSDPAGFADDTWLTKISEKGGGRKSDAGKGGDKKNITEDKSKPRYMLASGKRLADNGIMLASDIVEISDYSIFKAGDTLTYRMPVPPEGSRADIKATSRYADGGWSVLLHRKLDTGNEDDVAFNVRKKYNFALALFDDSGDENSYDSEVITLSFKR